MTILHDMLAGKKRMGIVMNRFLFGIAALATLIAGPALAADMPINVSSPASYDWTGLYVGAHVGWERAETQGSTTIPNLLGTVIAGPTDQKMQGWLGGAQLGYNQQFRRVVLGVEVSGSWGNARNLSSGAFSTNGGPALFTPPAPFACFQNVNISGPLQPQTNSFSCNAKQDWSAQALTRAGYTFGDGRILPYLSGGVGFTHLSLANTSNVVRLGLNQDTWGANRELVGAVVGGGLQYALGNGFSVGVEYLYANYGTKDFSSVAITATTNPPGSNSFPAFENHDLTTQTIRIVGNYKFD
jgi:opacity protein-like surface antigen